MIPIVLVNLEFPPIGGPGIWRVYALAKYFDALGHPVSVICSDRSSWHDLRTDGLAAVLPDRIAVHRQHSAFGDELVERCPSQERTFVSRAAARASAWAVRRFMPDPHFKWALDCVSPTVAALRRHPGSCLITSGPPHVSHIVGWLAQHRTGCRWIMDYRDLWLLDPTLSPADGRHRRVLLAAERRCLRRADAVVTVTPRWVEQLRVHAGLREPGARKFHLIRNGHDLDASLVEAVRQQSRRRPHLHLHFNGVMQVSVRRAFGKLFDALESIRDETGALPCLTVTVTGLHPRVADEIRGRRLEPLFEDLGYMAHTDALRWSAAADALMVPVAAGTPVAAGLIPAKAYEAMALGQHVFATVPLPSDAGDLFRNYGRATVVDSADVAAIAAALRSLVQAYAARSDTLGCSSARSREYLTAYARESQVREYSALVTRIMTTDSTTAATR